MTSGFESEKDSFTADDLRDICGCLLTMSWDDDWELERCVLAHYTVKEYLYSDRISLGPASQFALTAPVAAAVYSKAVLAVAVACQPGSWSEEYRKRNIRNFG